MKSDVDEIALQGIEFWSSVCDEEVDLAIEYSEVIGLIPYAREYVPWLVSACHYN